MRHTRSKVHDAVEEDQLTRLVRFTTDQTQTGAIIRRAHQPRLGVERAGLSGRIERLEAVAGLPIPKGDGAIVAYEKSEQVSRFKIEFGQCLTT